MRLPFGNRKHPGTDGAGNKPKARRDPPGPEAPEAERRLYEAITGADVEALHFISLDHPEYKRLALTVAGALTAELDPTVAAKCFAVALDEPWTDEADRYLQRYLPGVAFNSTVGPGLAVPVTLADMPTVVAMVTANAVDDHIRAASFVPKLDLRKPGYRALVAAVHHNAGDYGLVMTLTHRIRNVDDTSAFLLTLRGSALRLRYLLDTSRKVLTKALTPLPRQPGVRHLALLERAKVNMDLGRSDDARRDLDRIVDEDPTFEDVPDLLAELMFG